MSRRIRLSPAVKQRWFERGAAALTASFPQLAGRGYACPLCLRAATDIRAFTAEDVPPRSVGGRPLVLTCKECNDYGGHQLDWHWANMRHVEQFLLGELLKPCTATWTCGGASTTIELSRAGKSITAGVVETASSQTAVEQVKRHMLEVQPGTTFNITFHKSRYSEWRARLSAMRAGYLAVFAVAGYQFLRAWSPIREQLKHPDERRLMRLVTFAKNLPVD